MSKLIHSKPPLVIYLSYGGFGLDPLHKFIQNYVKLNSGANHELLICLKKYSENKIDEIKDQLDQKYNFFIDDFPINDFDIGSYFRIAEKFSNRNVFFIGTHSYPIKNNWLKAFVDNYDSNSILGASGSYTSIASQHLNFYYKKYSKFQQFRWGLKHFLKVKLFPNPHLRTSGLFLNTDDLLSLEVDLKKFNKKLETNYFESGRKSMTNQFLKKGFKIFVVNSDNKKFEIGDWHKSETFCIDSQDKLLISDKQSRIYDVASKEEKKKILQDCWGKKIINK